MWSILGVFIGGGLGSVLRYLLSIFVGKTSLSLPIATLFANVIACLILVLTIKLSEVISINPNLRLLIIIGFCGGLSTFSTFSFETAALIRQGQGLWAIANILISILLCIGIFYVALRKVI